MPLLAIPNVSEGSSAAAVAPYLRTIESRARVLDVHTDPVHNRSVFTVTGTAEPLVTAMTELAVACLAIDLRAHAGVHPRLGGLDVCPFVPHDGSMSDAVEAAHAAGEKIARQAQVPVFYYGAAARRAENKELPDIRRGGLEGLQARIDTGFTPDAGPARIDPRHGVACVGARGELIAFNIELDGDARTATQVAARVRDEHVRALGFALRQGRAQVSMNLIDPATVGIDNAYARVEKAVESSGTNIVATEIIGLVPERFLPDPDAKAARLLIEPGRSLESVLGD